MSTGVFL